MGRSPCCSKEGLNRGAWTATEDKILTQYILIHGEGKWRQLPKKGGLKRCGKSCRLRWLNYLRPDIKRGNITHDEEELIIRLHKLLGNRWSLIAGRLPGRTDNGIKNYWNTNIGKKPQNGNPNSSTSPNSSHTNPKTQQQTPNRPVIIRTKATRCNKVILTQEPQQLGTVVAPSMTYDSGTNDKMVAGVLVGVRLGMGSGSELLASTSPFDSEGNNPLDFMVDFEMDQSFFSDLLKVDFSELSCFENTVQDNNVSLRDKSQLSPKSHDNDTAFQSSVTLGEAEFDWL